MKPLHVSAVLRMLTAALVAVLSGCAAGSGFPVTGRLVGDGKPLSVSSERMPPGSRPIQIVFHTLSKEGGPAGESFHSEVNVDTGEFTVKGPAGKGIPAGKYRVSVVVLSSAPGGLPKAGLPVGLGGVVPNPAGVMGMSDRLKGFFSPERSRLEVEVTGPTQLVIDVGGKPGVTVQ